MRLALGLLLLPTILAAQAPDSLPRSGQLPVTDSALRLPVDRASDLLPWVAGGSLDRNAAPTWRGSSARGFDRITDGVRWASGIRSSGTFGNGALPVVLEPELNAIAEGEVGPTGHGVAAFRFSTLGGGDHWVATGSAESGAPFRPDGGDGTSRFEAAVGGPLGGSFRFRAAGTLLGRQSFGAGVGYGDDPIYTPDGVDTTISTQVGPDSVDIPIERYTASSTIPYTPRTEESLALRLDGRFGATEFWAHWLGSRSAERFLDYNDISAPQLAVGDDRSGSDLAMGIRRALSSGLRLDAAVVLQQERSEQGPLDPATESDSRDPALGLMLGGLDLRWTMDNFAIDDQLLANYRTNTPGSRRTPYDLENTAQYAVVDRYRNNAYALLGWSESGGPTSRLTMYADTRLVVQGGVTWAVGPAGAVRLGAEMVRHDAKYYSHRLTSQANSDVWLESPVEQALTAEWTGHGSSWQARAGARLDRFRTGAERLYLLDTASASPTAGRYLFFPRWSSYGVGVDSLRRLVEDDAHTALAPYVEASGSIGAGVVARGSARRTARMPDLSVILAGLNTDLAITNASSPFGSDMGHEEVDQLEVGVTRTFGPLTVDAALFHNEFRATPFVRLRSLYDPLAGNYKDLVRTELIRGGIYQGVTVSGVWRMSDRLRATGAYTLTDTADGSSVFGGIFPDGVVRPHAFAVALQADGPSAGTFSGLGTIVSFRRLSGAATGYVIGYDPPYPTRTKEIPAWTSLDLRVTKQLAWAGRGMTVYFDARNLLNAENLLRAFAYGDPKRDEGFEAIDWSSDSAAYASEGTRNGVYSGGGDIDLTFGGAGRGGCGTWQSASGASAQPNCAYLIAAEDRFGNGNGVFTLAEQRAASLAYYRTGLGRGALNGPPRAVRLGLQVAF